MKSTHQNLMHLIILIVIAAFFWWSKPTLSYPVSGIVLPALPTTLKPILPSQVKVLNRISDRAHVLAYIRTIRHVPISQLTSASMLPNLKLAQRLAAQVGARSLVLTGAAPSSSSFGFSNYILMAAAVA